MIEPVDKHNLLEVLPLIKSYQTFYQVKNIDDKKNAAFFSQFNEQSDKGCLFCFRKNNKVVAFASVYFSYATTATGKVAIMNDLYTNPNYRKQGIAKQLIQHCANYAKTKNAVRLQWLTAPSNTSALSVYKAVGAKQSSWEVFTYAL